MPLPAAAAVTALLAYLAGSIPFGYLTARLVGRIDIRTAGSGNIGATNVGRVLGRNWGLVVLGLDALKGLLPVLLLPRLVSSADADGFQHLEVLAGVMTVVGHMFPCWLGFRGGKGVATSLGVVLVLAPVATLVAFVAFTLTFALSRIVSLSSMLAAIAFAVWQMIQLKPTPFAPETWSLGAFSLIVPLLILIRHRGNIVRLLKGTEPRFRAARREGNSEYPRTDAEP